MNIWFIHNYATPPFTKGITKHFMLAKELKKLGHTPTIIAAHLNHKNQDIKIPKGKKYLKTNYQGIDYLWLKTFSGSAGHIKRVLNMFIFFLRLMTKTGLKELEKPDVIIGCSPEPIAAYAAMLMAKKYKVPFVLHMGDLWPLSLIDIGNISKYHPFIIMLAWIEKQLYKNATLIATPLPNIHEHVKSCGGNLDKILWLQNGVDTEKLPPYKKIKITPQEKFKIYYAGAHGPANALDAILDAAKIIQEKNDKIEFTFIGDGPDKKRLQKRCCNEKINNITFKDAVKKDEIFFELQKAHAFVANVKDMLVVRKGGIALNKLYDYMGAGRPTVISCSVPNNPIELASAGITTPSSDANAIANAVIKLQQMPIEELNKLGENGYNYVIKNHNYNKIGKKLESAIKNLRILGLE